jgi:CRISPR/Cas system-associated exonuclease Cas4 (RecB family)
MSKYYNSSRAKNIFDPSAEEPFKLSRSKIDLFIECPRCFYLDRRLGVGRPPGFPFNLNSAVDFLLKKEFDIHRAAGKSHPLMESYGLDLVPFSHEKLDEWRENFKGVQFYYEPANMILTGAIDDIWVDKKGVLYVVDYKSTSKDTEVNLDAAWQIGYKRQMEFYQWLLRKNGFKVSDTGYFVYCNGRRDVKAFDAKLEFDIKIIPYEGNDGWIEMAVMEAKSCLLSDTEPAPSPNCDYCNYREAVKDKEMAKDKKTFNVVKVKKPAPKKTKIQEHLI